MNTERDRDILCWYLPRSRRSYNPFTWSRSYYFFRRGCDENNAQLCQRVLDEDNPVTSQGILFYLSTLYVSRATATFRVKMANVLVQIAASSQFLYQYALWPFFLTRCVKVGDIEILQKLKHHIVAETGWSYTCKQLYVCALFFNQKSILAWLVLCFPLALRDIVGGMPPWHVWFFAIRSGRLDILNEMLKMRQVALHLFWDVPVEQECPDKLHAAAFLSGSDHVLQTIIDMFGSARCKIDISADDVFLCMTPMSRQFFEKHQHMFSCSSLVTMALAWINNWPSVFDFHLQHQRSTEEANSLVRGLPWKHVRRARPVYDPQFLATLFEPAVFGPGLLSTEEMAQQYRMASWLDAWINKLQEHGCTWPTGVGTESFYGAVSCIALRANHKQLIQKAWFFDKGSCLHGVLRTLAYDMDYATIVFTDSSFHDFVANFARAGRGPVLRFIQKQTNFAERLGKRFSHDQVRSLANMGIRFDWKKFGHDKVAEEETRRRDAVASLLLPVLPRDVVCGVIFLYLSIEP